MRKIFEPWILLLIISCGILVIAIVHFFYGEVRMGIQTTLIAILIFLNSASVYYRNGLEKEIKALKSLLKSSREVIRQQDQEIRFICLKFTEFTTDKTKQQVDEIEETADNAGAIG